MNVQASLNHEDLKKIFKISELKKYSDYTPLKGAKAGFSVQIEYPEDIRYKPPITKQGVSDTRALIFVYANQDEHVKTTTKIEVPIVLRITSHSRYLNTHWDYDFTDTENCPTRESVELSKRTPKPIELESLDEYFYVPTTQTLINNRTKISVSGEEIIGNIFKQHCNTIHPIKGLMLQWKMGSQKLGVKIIDLFIKFLIWLLRAATGRVLESTKDAFVGILKPYQKDNMKWLITEKINIFGYEASKNAILAFCVLVFGIHAMNFFFFKIGSLYVDSIVSNNTVLTAVIFLMLWLLDHVLPNFLFWMINKLILLKIDLMFLKLKF